MNRRFLSRSTCWRALRVGGVWMGGMGDGVGWMDGRNGSDGTCVLGEGRLIGWVVEDEMVCVEMEWWGGVVRRWDEWGWSGLGWVGLDWKVEGGGGEKRGKTMEACGDK